MSCESCIEAEAKGAMEEQERILRGLGRRVRRWRTLTAEPRMVAWHETLDIAEQIEAGAGDWSPEAEHHLKPEAGK